MIMKRSAFTLIELLVVTVRVCSTTASGDNRFKSVSVSPTICMQVFSNCLAQKAPLARLDKGELQLADVQAKTRELFEAGLTKLN